MKKGRTWKTLLALATAAASLAGMSGPAIAGDTSSTAGTWSGYTNDLDLSPTLTGDTLYGYNNGCMYAKFSHTAICRESSYYANGMWDGYVVEATNAGTPDGANCVYTTHWQSHFHNYDAASADYFYKSGYDDTGSNFVNDALSYSGTYSVTSSYGDNSEWYCSKLVSRAVYDDNGYNLGFLFWGSFITPYDVWADSAIYEYSHSLSIAYDGGGAYPAPSVATASTMQTSNTLVDSSATTYAYGQVNVQASRWDKEAQQAVDARIAAEQAAGKSAAGLHIVAPMAKPGEQAYLKSLVRDGKGSKAQVEAKFNVTDAYLD